MPHSDSWQRFQKYRIAEDAIGLSLDVSRMAFDDPFLARMEPAVQKAFEAMEALERGAIANPDENRMAGHYWLRSPVRAPTPDIAADIRRMQDALRVFVADVHNGAVRPAAAERFTQLLLIGIGGSALGPMLVSDALGDRARDRMTVHFLDNTDPDGIQRVLAELSPRLSETLTLVVSKSGTTPETRNGMLLVAQAYRDAGLDFARHAAAVTGVDSAMDRQAREEKWLARFPMWDWVGGRTSEFSAVGLLPAALQGLDIDALLSGAAACDAATRRRETLRNPAALLALMWGLAGEGRGARDMVVLPYKDRLLLFSRYLQQLVMESLGKRLDLQGRIVEQGLSVYGNKGSTDQHAYVQQLRDGLNNFFAVFVRVLEDGGSSLPVEPNVTAGDFLHGFLLGTREALFENGRQSITLSIRRVDAFHIGVLIALFERTVGVYAAMIGINAYHQPGVESGKKAAANVLALQSQLLAALTREHKTAEQLAAAIGKPDAVETVFLVLEHLAANGRIHASLGPLPAEVTFARMSASSDPLTPVAEPFAITPMRPLS